MLDRIRRPILRGIRPVLFIGYGGLLGLLVLLGAYAARSLTAVARTNLQSSRTYVQRNDRIEAIRAAAYTTSSQIRDYLLDPDPNSLDSHRRQTHSAWNQTLAALKEYRDVASPQRAATLLRLEKSLREYWAAAETGLNFNETGRRNSGYGLLTERLSPLRDQFLAALDETRTLEQRDMRDNIQASSALIQTLQNRLWLVIVLTLLLGLMLAIVTWTHLFRLERAAQAQYRASLDSAAELEQLSQRLLNVQEEERRTLARELHDEVGQTVGALLVDLGQARSVLTRHPKEAGDRLDSAHSLAETAMRTVRNLCLLLRPSMLDDLGLVPALHWQARETSRRTGLDVHITATEEDLDLPDALRTTIYRVVQEALQNAARHSRAAEVEIVVQKHDHLLRILVRDNGAGFDPKLTRGLGLLGMQERISQMSGHLTIESAPGQGTILKMEIPLEEAIPVATK